jgi:transposase
MPKSYSCDLRERVIEMVEAGASRHEAAEHFGVSVSSVVKWMQRWSESRSAAPKPRGGSVLPLEQQAERVVAVIMEQPDLTLEETAAEFRRHVLVELGSENRLRRHSRGLTITVDRSLPGNLLEAHTETAIGEAQAMADQEQIDTVFIALPTRLYRVR